VTFLLLPHYMGALVPEGCRVLGDHIAGYSALLVGPGLGRDPRTAKFVMQLLTGEAPSGAGLGFVRARAQATSDQLLPPTVIDADGCNALADTPEWWSSVSGGNVLTPHPGEMSRLLGCSVAEIQSDRIEVARRASQQWNQIVVLKGAYTVIAEPGGQATINPFANPALASAGTGDVLAGAVVGLLAQGIPAYDAAVAAAYIHGLAGRQASRQIGQAGLVASDLLPGLPRAIRLLREPKLPLSS
jgi:NAD(P)H-hydrate epimerase